MLLAAAQASGAVDPLGSADIRILGLQVDLDTRPDIDGIQSTLTAVKDIPTGALAVVGAGAVAATGLPAGAVVRAELSGPALGNSTVTLSAAPNQLLAIPPLGAAGSYRLTGVRLEDDAGNVLLRRDPTLAPVLIDVIDELLVTQVTSRPLTLEEIEDKGIVIDEDNFTAFNFAIGLTLGSEQVVIDLPVAIPSTQQAALTLERPSFTDLPAVRSQLDRINIPNFSLAGFQLRPPPEVEARGIEIPPINGVVVIPGNIAFLNQFFSVVLQATNVAPAGSGLVLENARASIALPPGDDELADTGDDPLRMAETAAAGVQTELPLTGTDGGDAIAPQATHDAEFLVEGLREGTHTVTFDIAGDLFVPAIGETVPLTGNAAGVVQVKNPTFSMVLAHPDVVRDGEAYSLFATVTNTSTVPANLFKLQLNARSLSGARLADGEDALRTLESLAPGEAQTFEYRLVARTTGEVTGTVFLADEGINGSFVLNTGVGDTGIPLSPDTLVLPQTVDYLPDDPDLVFATVRMLGQAYSVATAPAGALPPEIARISRGFVFERAVKVAQAGLHLRFGETPTRATQDILMDWLGNDLPRLAARFPDDPQAAEAAERDLRAFDALRRAADAGHDLSDTFAALIGGAMNGEDTGALQQQWAEAFASRPAHLSFGASSRGPPLSLALTDAAGNRLGRLDAGDTLAREIPFGARLALGDRDELLLLAAPEDAYDLAFRVHGDGALALSVVVPDVDGMVRVVFPEITLAAGGGGSAHWQRDDPGGIVFQVDADGDGTPETTLAPVLLEPVVDAPPTLLGVHQWGRGQAPSLQPTFEHGDPIGRMVGVLFSEEVDAGDAAARTRYAVADNRVVAASVQPDARLVFVVLDRPIGPFVPASLTVRDVADLRGNVMPETMRAVTDDPDRGTGGVFSGRVVSADGQPVPFAQVKYLQPLSFRSLFDACTGDRAVLDHVITTYETDADGRFSIDYVLRAEFPESCPGNADIWLNRNNASGTSNFKLEATHPLTGDVGRASSRITFDGQRQSFDVIIRGYGAIQGTVYDEDGHLVTGGDPGTAGELAVTASNTSTGEVLRSWVDAQGGYSFPRAFAAADGSELEVPRPAVGNVILNIVRPADGYTAVATVNIPQAGARVTQDLVMVPATRYGSVTGRVLEADGSTGAAHVPVQITAPVLASASAFERTFTPGIVGATVTDADGTFRFDNVPTGDIALRALRQSTFEQADATSFLDEGETEDVVLLFPGSGGTIEGVVRDALGNPVAGAVVGAGPVVTRADANGLFRLAGLPLGSFTVFAQGADSPALGQARVDTLGPDDVQSVVITLQAVGSIQGTLREADGVTPIAGQAVQLWVGNDGVMAETLTDTDGRYRFVNYPLRDYIVRAVRADRGDGGQAFTTIRFAGDSRDADITFRGLGRIRGRVIQSNGTPAISDVIITRKVWRIIPDTKSAIPNPYLDFIKELGNVDEALKDKVDGVLRENNLDQAPPVFFMLMDEPVLLSSDILGPGGEVTGEFSFDGPVTGGAFTVAAFGPFLSPAEVAGAIPVTTVASERNVDVGDIVLEPSVGRVTGTVFLPDGITPVGENVRVTIRSLDDSGAVPIPGGSVSQPVLPELDVVTDADGRFEFPIVLRGGFVLNADTGVPDPSIRADDPAGMETTRFDDAAGMRALNVRLFGQVNGVVPRGETLDVDLRLRDVAGVDVQVVANDGVTPVPFAEVSLHTASTLDAPFEAGFQQQVADADGVIRFFPVIEGAFQVSAREPGTPARGSVNGEVPRDPANGHVESVRVTLGAVTSASGQVVPASIFGSVEGTVFTAAGEVLANPAEVRVRSGNVEVLATTDASGRYRAEDVPGGWFTVDVFEPFTARRGSADGRIASDGEVVETPVTLIGLGTVTGEVFRNDGSQRLPAVDVVLFPSGNFTDSIVSRSDADGRYRLPGVPLGPYMVKATDLASGLTGEASDLMRADGDVNTTDVFLEASGRIAGTVFAPGTRLNADGDAVDGNGAVLADPPVVPGATVTIAGAGFTQDVQTDAAGQFVSGMFLRTGAYTVTARPPAGNDGATAATVLEFDGEIRDVALVLRGSGRVEGRVVDAVTGVPETAARVTLFSDSPFAAGAVTRFTDADGLFLFDEVPVGEYSLSVQTTLRAVPLGASATGEVASHDEVIAWFDGDADTAHDAIRLEDTAEVIGRVLLEDGQTPAAGAIVELRGAGIRLARVTGDTGTFAFAGLPLANYLLDVLEPGSNGVALLSVTLDDNGEQVDLGDLVVDATPPEVLATSPAAYATDVFPTDPVTVTFSEPVDPASVSDETFRVTIDGEAVAGTLQVPAQGVTATFFPQQQLPDRTRVRVEVRAPRIGFEGQQLEDGITDRQGLGLVADTIVEYTTADTRPPSVVGVSPADGAVEVPLASVVRIEFSEPVNPATVNAFTLSDDGTPVSGTMNANPILGGRVLVFTPTAPLWPDTHYRVDLDGDIEDLSGNALVGGVHTGFHTLDTLAPVIAALAADAQTPRVQGAAVPVTVALDDPDDVRRVDFFVDGALLASVDAAPFIAPVLLAGGVGTQVVVSAVAEDHAGNRSAPVSLTLAIDDNEPPAVTIASPANGVPVAAGEVVTVVVQAQDDLGIAQVSFTANGGAAAAGVQVFDGSEQDVQHPFAFEVPAGLPVGSTLALRAAATDSQGQRSETAPVELSVTDRSPPAVTVVSPADGARVDPGDTLTVLLRADDPGAVAALGLDADGATPATASQVFAPATTPATHAFTVSVPADAPPTQAVVLTATATDSFGNTASRGITLAVNDLLPPTVAVTGLPASVDAEPGDTLAITVRASDTIGVARVELAVDGGAPQVVDGGGAGAVEPVFQVPVPAAQPFGSTLQVSVAAEDTSGNRTLGAGLTIRVRDLTAPTVSITAPAPGTEVLPGDEIAVAVSATDNDRLASITLDVSGAVTASRQHVVDPPAANASPVFDVAVPADAAAGSILTLRVTASDVSGRDSAVATRTVRVADVVPPQVLSLFPADGATAVAPDVVLEARFDEAVDAASIDAASVALTREDDGTPVAAARTVSGDRVTLDPAIDLDLGVTYVLDVTTGVRDLAGNGLAAPVRSRFQVENPDVTGPRLLAFTPADGAVDVGIRPAIRALFDEPLADTAAARASLALEDAAGTPVAATVSLADGGASVLLVPDAALAFGAGFTAVLGAGATDLAGNPATASDGSALVERRHTFTTTGFGIVRPSAGDRFAEGETIEIEAVVASAGIASVEFAADGVVFRDAASAPYVASLAAPAPGTTGELTLRAVARDGGGNAIASDEVVVALYPAMDFGATIHGVPAGETVNLRLHFSSPAPAPLTIDFTTADPGVVAAPASRVLLAGDTHLDVALTGGGDGATTLTASGLPGEAAAVLAVGPRLSDAPYSLHSPAIGMSVPPPARQALPLRLIGTGVHTVLLSLLDAPRGEPTTVLLSSTAPALVAVPAEVVVPAGATTAPVTLTAHGEGSTMLRARTGDVITAVPVHVGPAAVGDPLLHAQPVGVAVTSPFPALPLSIPAPGNVTLRLPVLPAPAAQSAMLDAVSSDESVVRIAGAATTAGSTVVALSMEAVNDGTARITLSHDGTSIPLTFTVGGGAGRSGVQSQPAGFAVPPYDSAGRIAVPAPGSRTLVLPLLSEAADADLVVPVTSSATDVASVPGTVTLHAGATSVTLTVEALAFGETTIRLTLPDRVVAFTLLIDPDASPGRTASQPVGVAVSPAGSAGTLYSDPTPGVDVMLPLLQAPVADDTTVQLSSRDPAVAQVLAASATIPAGGVVVTVPLAITGTDGETALIELRIGGETYVLRIVVGLPLPGDVPLTVSPTVGVAVDPVAEPDP